MAQDLPLRLTHSWRHTGADDRERAVTVQALDQPVERLAASRSHAEFNRLLAKLPAAAYTCNTDGLITYFNERAVELWGREPRLNDPVDRFCGSFRLFS